MAGADFVVVARLRRDAKLFDLPADECARVLRSLVQDGSLIEDEDGRYRLR